jgi:hypothetical protein
MGLKEFIAKLLGVDELKSQVEGLNNKLNIIESEKVGLEKKLIESEKKSQFMKKNAISDINDSGLVPQSGLNYLISQEFNTSENKNYLASVNAVQLVERYGLKRYEPSLLKKQKSPIITVDEFRNNYSEYLPRLNDGFLNYPLNLNISNLNEILFKYDMGLIISPINVNSNNGTINFDHKFLSSIIEESIPDSENGEKRQVVAENKEDVEKFSLVLYKAFELANLKRNDSKYSSSHDVDIIDFLYNSDNFESIILENPSLNLTQKKKALDSLEFTKNSLLTAIEIVATTRIKDSSELLNYSGYENDVSSITDLVEYKSDMKIMVRDLLLRDMEGTRKYDLDKLVEVKSSSTFRELASKRTLELISKDKKNKGFTSIINKPIDEYSIGESVALASYFARNIIDSYSTLEDTIKDIFSGIVHEGTTGKCTDYAGLALQYLNEYLVPLNPDKFANWTFSSQKTDIGDYKHAYIKVIHQNQDKTIDVYFVDPTMLSNHGTESLKTPKDIYDKMNTSNFPILIKRSGEDFLAENIE